jgi:hypothetical protein
VVVASSKVEEILKRLLAIGFILWWDGCLPVEDLLSSAPILDWQNKEKLPFHWGDEFPPQ